MEEPNSSHARMKWLIVGVGIAFAVVAVFSFGVFIGEQKARFSFRWSQEYRSMFGRPPIGPGGPPEGLFGGHGTVGVVIDRKADQLLLKSPDNVEKVILIGKSTHLVRQRQEIKPKDIRNGDRAVVIGSPDNKGRIEAKLVRILDAATREDSLWGRNAAPPPLPPL